MTLLDDLSGFEFEETMAIVFEKLGYEDVEVAEQVADKGRDVIMTDPDDGAAVIVECKHTDSVSRPDIQKLDSAVSTYEYDGPTRGMIATTGRLTNPAERYANRVDIEILDGRRLRSIADEIGMDIYNGRIEIVCEDTLTPIHPRGTLTPIYETVQDIRNLTRSTISSVQSTLTLVPVVAAQTHVSRTFETGAGVIRRLDARSTIVLDASRGGPTQLSSAVQSLVVSNLDHTESIDIPAYHEIFETVHKRRFGRTENEYRDAVIDRTITRHTKTVTYTGDNNVTYEQECEPRRSDVTIEAFEPVYAPRVNASVPLGDHTYDIDWYGAGSEVAVTTETFHACRVCDEADTGVGFDLRWVHGRLVGAFKDPAFTYCDNCGRIACRAHIRTERLTGEPVCTACATVDRFSGARRYFFDDDNRAAFSDQYDAMHPIDKVRENTLAIGVAIATVFLLLLLALA